MFIIVLEPGYSFGALPERPVSGRQQAGGDYAQPGPLGGQEGVDEGRAGVAAEADVLQRGRARLEQRTGDIGKRLHWTQFI